jgi:PadR family transcriptional regulator AphA
VHSYGCRFLQAQIVRLDESWYNFAERHIPKYTMASAVSIRHFILGLLTRQPMSGYDIKRFLKSLSWLIDSPSFGSLYPALHALLEDGLVTVEILSRQDKPPRKIYTITEKGRQALQEWMDRPIAPGVSLKAFVMRLILASNLSHASLIAYLEQRHNQVATHQLALEQTAQATDDDMDLGERLALDYGLAVAAAELAWLDRALTQLSEGPLTAGAT